MSMFVLIDCKSNNASLLTSSYKEPLDIVCVWAAQQENQLLDSWLDRKKSCMNGI